MLLEQRIKQNKPFPSENERAAVNILYSANWILEHMRNFLARFGITQQQYNALRILRGKFPESLSTGEIRERMVDRAPDASRIVDRMIAKGLVQKAACTSDKRRIDVTITQAGLDLLETIEQSPDRPSNLVRGLTAEESAQLNALLEKMKKIDNDSDGEVDSENQNPAE